MVPHPWRRAVAALASRQSPEEATKYCSSECKKAPKGASRIRRKLGGYVPAMSPDTILKCEPLDSIKKKWPPRQESNLCLEFVSSLTLAMNSETSL